MLYNLFRYFKDTREPYLQLENTKYTLTEAYDTCYVLR